MKLSNRNFLSLQDFTKDEIQLILNKAKEFKDFKKKGKLHNNLLQGNHLCMIFQKPSTRTIVSFDVAMKDLGGTTTILTSNEMQLGRGETICDTGRTLARYCDFIMARVFDHNNLIELARGAGCIPVINGLSDLLHPCQILADLLTIEEHKSKLDGLKLAYVGDGNNVANSLLIGCSKMGCNVTIACPEGYKPKETMIMIAKHLSENNQREVEIISRPKEAVKEADIIYTDTWISMGQESQKKERVKVFKPYQVNRDLIKYAKPDVIVMHCLPAHRGYEITNEVLDGPHSVIFDQAENRLHTQKALLYLLK